MHLGLHQSARMEQRLSQSPQMIQAMQILQLSSVDLERRIEEELLENPLLERPADPLKNGAGHGGEGERLPDVRDVAPATRDRDRWDSEFRPPRGSAESADAKHQALQNSPARPHSLGESLLGQLSLMELSGREKEMVEVLLFSLDARGYLPYSVKTLADECSIDGASEEAFEALLQRVRTATHPALGATDLRECLLLQLGPQSQGDCLLRILITDCLEDVAANRIPRIARATGASVEEVGQAISVLRRLDPSPGRAYGDALCEVIRPEIAVEEADGAFVVRLTSDQRGGLRVSSDYTAVLRNTSRGDPAAGWIRERRAAARWFVHALDQRQGALLRIARAIFERQQGFLEHGRAAMKPLRMAEVADLAGVHLSTVSRAVAAKYAQTPQGILPLRSLFSAGLASASGEMVSQQSIREQVLLLIDEEDPAAPYSDDQLADLLGERQGVRLARRTISKYRKNLDIASSRERRVF